MSPPMGNAIFDPAGFRAAIFDLDGTLVHSEPAWEEAKIIVARRYGATPSRALLDAYVGRGLAGFLDDLFGTRLPAHTHRKLGDEIGAEADHLLPRMREPVPGAAAFLQHLHRQGLRIAVCSSSPRRHILAALDHLGLLDAVEAIVSGAELPRGKPDPLPFVTTLALLDLPARRVFAVEDSLPGARSAHGAGLVTLAIGPGCTSRPEFGFCAHRAETYADLPLPAGFGQPR